MKALHKKFIVAAGIAAGLITAAVACVLCLLMTETGSIFLFRKILLSVFRADAAVWQKYEGSFLRGMAFENMEITDSKQFPLPNKLKIQTIAFDVDSLSLRGVALKIANARLTLPGADPILAFGSFQDGKMDFNVSSRSLTVYELERSIGAAQLPSVRGDFSGIDIYVKGDPAQPQLEGKFVIDEITSNGFSLAEAQCDFHLTLKRRKDPIDIQGYLVFHGGLVGGKKTAVVRLEESRIMFSGDPANPGLNINGASEVGQLKIRVALKGDVARPDLQISSTPPMDQSRLLLALATNQTWERTEEAFATGTISSDMARDFIDYFIFNGRGAAFAERLGLKDISIQYDGQTKGVAITKDISEKLEGRYEIEQESGSQQPSQIRQKIGGEYQVTNEIAVEGRTELKKESVNGPQERNGPPDAQIFLKYEKPF